MRGLCMAVLLTPLFACVGDLGSPEASSGTNPPIAEPSFTPAAPTLHRLTRTQLGNAWTDLLGEVALPTELPNDDRLYGFASISAASTTIAPLDAEQYEAATYEVLDQAWNDPARRALLLGCDDASFGDACVTAFLTPFMERAWRRPVSEDEVSTVRALMAEIGADLDDPILGVKFGLAAVLQSPHFLFRVEIGEPAEFDGFPILRYTSWEMASRLSFLLTDAPPDEDLRAAAAAGELTDPTAVEREAARLLESPRASEALTRFFRDFMNISSLDSVDKSAEAFPQFSATMGASMRVEMEHIFQTAALDPHADFRTVFSTRETLLNEELANVYGVEWPAGGTGFLPFELAASGPRAGLLTSAGFLALNAHETQTSPTHRGRFVRINLLCQDIPPPPPGTDTSLEEPEPGAPMQTLRQRLAQHRDDPECSSCHDQMDPIGFAFEQFDAIGQYRTVDENGLTLDVTTDVDGQPIVGAIEMSSFIASLPRASACVARRFYEHAGAHLASDGEEEHVQEVVNGFVTGDYVFQKLVLTLVTNDGFRYGSPEAATEEEGQ